jgi:PKD domain
MRGLTTSGRRGRASALVTAVLAAGATVIAVACAATSTFAAPAIDSPLPGYPRFEGVMLVHDDSPANIARESGIGSASTQEAAGAPSPQSSPLLSGAPTPNCTVAGAKPGSNLCWWGGQVLKAHTVHLIFWEGPEGTHKFPTGYVAAVERYFEDVAAATGSIANVYSVGAQYGDSEGPGEYKVSFNKAEDVYADTTNALPASGSAATDCTDPTAENKAEPCVTDKDLQEEITRAQTAMAADHWEKSLHHAYCVFTPPKVGGCFYSNEEETAHEEKGEPNTCAFARGGYCAYHSHFGTEPEWTVYADIPDDGEVGGCDTYEYPNGAEGVDASLSATSREHNELITDPLGNGWHDLSGEEIGDKCDAPGAFEEVVGVAGLEPGPVFGGAHGGEAAKTKVVEGELVLEKPGSEYNEEIGAGKEIGDYWLQTEWSNTATEAAGGCEQRMVNVKFEPPSSIEAKVPVTYSGSLSGEAGDPISYYVWDFGDGVQLGTSEPTVTHTYVTPGKYPVTLTTYDRYGNSQAISKEVEVGPERPASTSTTTSSGATTATVTSATIQTVTVATTETVTTAGDAPPVAHYSSSQLAATLGLPRAGAKLTGLGAIAFGHGRCPPACSVSAHLFAKVAHQHHATKMVPIGAATLTIAEGATRAIALKLNSTGRAMLRKQHELSVQLELVVGGEEGGAWQLSRSYTLSATGSKASRRRA